MGNSTYSENSVTDFSDIRLGYIELFNKSQWEWFITVSFPYRVSPKNAERLFKEYLKNLKKREKLKITGIGIINVSNHDNCHIHFALRSEKTNYTKRLADVSIVLWEFKWLCRSGGTSLRSRRKSPCKIELVHESKGIGYYMAKEKNLRLYRPDDWSIIELRKNILQ